MAEDYGKERAARFGKLPERVRPDDAVESVDTKVRRGRPESAMSEEQDRALLGGG
ncbi:hypothetical protein ACFY36_48635 [Actinoplanes sp. NPDC000266]